MLTLSRFLGIATVLLLLPFSPRSTRIYHAIGRASNTHRVPNPVNTLANTSISDNDGLKVQGFQCAGYFVADFLSEGDRRQGLFRREFREIARITSLDAVIAEDDGFTKRCG